MFGKHNEDKQNKKAQRKEKRSGKLQMYDYILAGLYEGESVVEPQEALRIDNLDVGFNSISSATYVNKYYIIKRYPYYLHERLIDNIRDSCLKAGVKMDFYIHAEPHEIPWESDEMQNRQKAWKRYTTEDTDVDTFEIREKASVVEKKLGIRRSWQYLQVSDLEQRRKLCKMYIIVQISGLRTSDGQYLAKMENCIKDFKRWAASNGVKIAPLSINLGDWLQVIYPLSLRFIKEVNTKIPKQVMTDDILARINSYKQGKIGYTGLPVGMDVNSRLPVIKDVFANSDNAENWIISSKTGAGKSVFVKDKIPWALALDIPVMVVDFEGDEYRNMYWLIKDGNPKDAILVDFGQGNGLYADPLIIPNLTGNKDVDKSLKSNAISVTKKMLSIMIKGNAAAEFDTWEEGVISSAIRDLYESYLITDDPSTWKESKNLRLSMISDIINDYVTRQTFRNEANDNAKHRAAIEINERLKVFFVEGESRYGTFLHPISIDDLLGAKFILFCFGETGKTASEIDATTLQLKQHSVANLMNQISNYCKYIKKTLNLKIIEEYQRYVDVPGSREIVCNIVTGGRKRGDIVMINTNDLNAILGTDKTSETLRQNITTWAIGAIVDRVTRTRFCEMTEQKDLLQPLYQIAKANDEKKTSKTKHGEAQTNTYEISKKMSSNRYYKAFCVVLDNTERAVVRVELSPDVLETKIYTTDRETGNKGG